MNAAAIKQADILLRIEKNMEESRNIKRASTLTALTVERGTSDAKITVKSNGGQRSKKSRMRKSKKKDLRVGCAKTQGFGKN